MIVNIAGNLGLVEQEDKSFRPYVLYRILCTESRDTNTPLVSVFQVKYNKGYKMVAKINEFIDSDIFYIDSKSKKDFITSWLNAATDCNGLYLRKSYYHNKNTIAVKEEEKFVSTPVDFFFGVKCAVDCIKMRNLFQV